MDLRHPPRNAARRQRSRGHLLIAASVFAWAGTMSLNWQFGGASPLDMMPWAIAGGVLGGALGAARSLPDRLPKDEGWVIFRMVSTFAAAGAWLFVLEEVWRNAEISEHLLNFFLGYVVYMIARDVFQTLLLLALSKADERRREADRAAQRARIFAMTAARANVRPAGAVVHLPLEQLSKR